MEPIFYAYTWDILEHPKFQALRALPHHGADNSVYDHSVATAELAFHMARGLGFSGEDVRRVTRAALLHDFFGYNWHGRAYRRYVRGFHGLQRISRMHAFIHGPIAAQRAAFWFDLDQGQREAIALHMFPLCFPFPRHKEAWVVTAADKAVATREVLALAERRCGWWLRRLAEAV